MPLYYCSLHAQLLVVKHQGWMHFSQEKIDEIRGYYKLLRSADFESSYLQVSGNNTWQNSIFVHS